MENAMAKQSKPIHLITMWGCRCKAVCDRGVMVEPIGSLIRVRPISSYLSKGTFDPTKITCKRCLNSEDYKTAMDRIKYPLFFLEK